MLLECYHCFKIYSQELSLAQDPRMFCSQGCQEDEDAMIAEGNKIIEASEKANPGFTLGLSDEMFKPATETSISELLTKMKLKNTKV
jgi:hypothetical protein